MSRIGDIDAGTYDVDTMVPLSRIEAILLHNGGGGESEMKKIIVDELPETGIDDNAIYMVPGANPTGDNQYDEYVHTPRGWELVSSADLSDIPDDDINNLWT